MEVTGQALPQYWAKLAAKNDRLRPLCGNEWAINDIIVKKIKTKLPENEDKCLILLRANP